MDKSELEKLYTAIDAATAPDKMSQQEALNFLEELAAELEGRMDALRGEVGDVADD